jgi:glycine cleavage system H protein
MYPEHFKYTQDHEWVSISGHEGRIGITDYAQKQLGDIVFLELPELGRRYKKGEVLGTIESVKAVSEIFSPVSGEVVEVNSGLTQKPESVNQDPHGSWMIVLKLTHPSEADGLLSAAQYAEIAK